MLLFYLKVKKNIVSKAPILMKYSHMKHSQIQNTALFSALTDIYIGLNSLKDGPKESIKTMKGKNQST